MTSKEAVLELICEAKSVNFDDERICFLRKLIEKDLEVLEEHRKIEEELGIELTVLFSALKYGVYYLEDDCQILFDNIGLHNLAYDNVSLISNYISTGPHDKLSYSFITFSERRILSFADYGKTRFLVKKDLIRFIDIGEDDTTTSKCRYEPHIDENTLYRITYVLKNVEKYGLDKDYCILAIKKLEIKEK